MTADWVRVRFLRPFGAYRRGDVISYPIGPARSWLAIGLVERVEEEQQLLEQATAQRRGVETADARRRRVR